MNNKIGAEKLKKYEDITKKALKLAKKSVVKSRENDAEEIIQMVSNYLSDSVYFRNKKDFVNAFAAINYAHGWLDAGARLGIFNVKDSKLFTVK